MKYRFVNLTGHDICLSTEEKDKIIFKPSGKVARVEKAKKKSSFYLNGSIIYLNNTLIEVTNLPKKEKGVIYIASKQVCEALKRDDFVYPTDCKKNYKTKKVIYCKGFGFFKEIRGEKCILQDKNIVI